MLSAHVVRIQAVQQQASVMADGLHTVFVEMTSCDQTHLLAVFCASTAMTAPGWWW
jgi:hypothetical protein